MFAHDWRDAWLVILGLFELGGKVAIVMFWAVLPVPITLLSMVGLCLLNCTNYICVAHYFLHTPSFPGRGSTTFGASSAASPWGCLSLSIVRTI